MRKVLRYLPQMLEIVAAIEEVQEGGVVTIRPTIKGRKFAITVQRLQKGDTSISGGGP